MLPWERIPKASGWVDLNDKEEGQAASVMGPNVAHWSRGISPSICTHMMLRKCFFFAIGLPYTYTHISAFPGSTNI